MFPGDEVVVFEPFYEVSNIPAHCVMLMHTREQAVAYLPYVLPIYKQSHPDARLEVVCEESPQLVERVRDPQAYWWLSPCHQGAPSRAWWQ